MRKNISLVLVVVLLANLYCVPVSATPRASTMSTVIEDESVHDAIVQMAVHAFPEYADVIASDTVGEMSVSQTQGVNSEPNIVVNETRAVSETESIQYTQYDNGISLLSVVAYPAKNQTAASPVTFDDGRTGTVYTVNAWMTVLGSTETLMVNGIRFYILSNSTCAFLSLGSISDIQAPSFKTIGSYQMTGSNSDPAYCNYTATFTIELASPNPEMPIYQFYDGTLHLEVNGSSYFVDGY